MILSVRTLLLSHGIVFLGGCVLGKLINQDELETYRSIHESGISRFRRNTTTIALTIVSLGTVYMVVRLTTATKTNRALND
jgi:hypothetical protein